VDPDLTAEIDFLESSLCRDLWQFGSALVLLDRATQVFVSLGEQDGVARAVIGRANVHIVKGDWLKATAILQGALEWPFDSRFTLVVRHNLADVLVKAGRAREADQLFSATRDLYDPCTDTLMHYRRLWLEGLIARELGDDLHHAEGILELATENLMAKGYAGDAALAELDLRVTKRKLALARKSRSRSGPTPIQETSTFQRLPDPLHPRIAPAQQHAHPAAAEPAVGEGSGQAGGAGGLHHHS
jgi:hypothetical protein